MVSTLAEARAAMVAANVHESIVDAFDAFVSVLAGVVVGEITAEAIVEEAVKQGVLVKMPIAATESPATETERAFFAENGDLSPLEASAVSGPAVAENVTAVTSSAPAQKKPAKRRK